MHRYKSRQDAIDNGIKLALAQYVDDYDVDAIADEILAYRVDRDADGNELLDTAGFEDVTERFPATFWAIVEKHAKSE